MAIKKGILFSLLILAFSLCANLTYGIAEQNRLKIEVIYFHATIRCESCLLIERQTRETIEQVYSTNLKDGTLSFSSLDFQDEQNSELAERYEIDSQTLIVQISNGSKVIKWKKLEKIWEYMNNYEKFRKYIVEEINEYLKEVKNGESKN